MQSSFRQPARSYLFAPGSRMDLLEKVFDAGADAVVLDLEDAVAVGEKEIARKAVATVIEQRADQPSTSLGGPQCWVRVNALGSPHWKQDLEAVVRPGLGGVRLPKLEDPALLETLETYLLHLERDRGWPERSIPLTGTIESARGLYGAVDLARCERLDRLAFGASDFVADIGADGSDEVATLYARSQLVVAARVAELLPPIAPAYTLLSDSEGLLETTMAAKRLGFFGRSCLHPKQLATVHEVFTPSAEQLARAQSIVSALEQGLLDGVAATTLDDGTFIDEAVARQARSTLLLAQRTLPQANCLDSVAPAFQEAPKAARKEMP